MSGCYEARIVAHLIARGSAVYVHCIRLVRLPPSTSLYDTIFYELSRMLEHVREI